MVHPPGLLQQLPLKHAKLDLKHRRSHPHQANACYSLQLSHVGNGAVMNIRYLKLQLFCQKQPYIYKDYASVYTCIWSTESIAYVHADSTSQHRMQWCLWGAALELQSWSSRKNALSCPAQLSTSILRVCALHHLVPALVVTG